MPTMYDSVTPDQIPKNAQIVAGYIDGDYGPSNPAAWTPEAWAMFPHAETVRITISASNDDGRVLDVESGDATPEQAPGWVEMRRRSTVHPLAGPACIYCNLLTWPQVKAAFVAAKVAAPDYWIAHYDGIAEIIPGAVAKQYLSTTTPNLDTSITVDTWPVAPKPPAPKPKPAPIENPAAHAYALAHGMVVIDRAEAIEANHSHPHIEWYVWLAKLNKMVPEPINITSETSIIYAYANVLDAAGIPHAGP